MSSIRVVSLFEAYTMICLMWSIPGLKLSSRVMSMLVMREMVCQRNILGVSDFVVCITRDGMPIHVEKFNARGG